ATCVPSLKVLYNIFLPCIPRICLLFFLSDTAPAEIYTLSLHDALPISDRARRLPRQAPPPRHARGRGHHERHGGHRGDRDGRPRSEEHTSELQSRENLVCRLLLEKKKADI